MMMMKFFFPTQKKKQLVLDLWKRNYRLVKIQQDWWYIWCKIYCLNCHHRHRHQDHHRHQHQDHHRHHQKKHFWFVQTLDCFGSLIYSKAMSSGQWLIKVMMVVMMFLCWCWSLWWCFYVDVDVYDDDEDDVGFGVYRGWVEVGIGQAETLPRLLPPTHKHTCNTSQSTVQSYWPHDNMYENNT